MPQSSKYHFNPNTGEVGPCRAKIQCKFGLAPGAHFETPQAAADAYQASRNPLPPTLKRRPSEKTLEDFFTDLYSVAGRDPGEVIQKLRTLVPMFSQVPLEHQGELLEAAHRYGYVPDASGKLVFFSEYEEESAPFDGHPTEALVGRWREVTRDPAEFLRTVAAIDTYVAPQARSFAFRRIWEEQAENALYASSSPQEATRLQLALMDASAPEDPVYSSMLEVRGALLGAEERYPSLDALKEAAQRAPRPSAVDPASWAATQQVFLKKIERVGTSVEGSWKILHSDFSQSSPAKQVAQVSTQFFSDLEVFRGSCDSTMASAVKAFVKAL